MMPSNLSVDLNVSHFGSFCRLLHDQGALYENVVLPKSVKTRGTLKSNNLEEHS